ncbi:MAG: SMP-30/gluconolactonase/LRE family protein [Devosia sp.]
MRDTAELFIDSRCELGEGPFWHPLQDRLFWFDILNKTLYSATAGGIMVDRFIFETYVSAAGIIDADNLGIASASGIFKLNLPTDGRELLVPLEPSAATRANDGRVNPAGGLWIGTMGLKDPGRVAAGSLYQVRNGKAERLAADIFIPNATCFSPDGRTAYFADTIAGVIRKIAIDPETGLPIGEWQEFVGGDHPGDPDGAIVDAEGFVWNARWGGSCVIRFSPDGKVDRVVKVPVSKVTCPALGGKDFKTLYLTSAREGMSPDELAAQPGAGSIFALEVDVPGLPEPLFRA